MPPGPYSGVYKNQTTTITIMPLFKSTKNQSASAATTPAQTPRPSVDAQRPAPATKLTPEQALDSILSKTVQTMPAIFGTI
ncbi:MAG: hypothetical protein J3R72DRAFT_524640 [Linnemannia gamsii]|nr:MAG: hypothetical protein J3R72DRAFT_524640 [Linnemannia gamsii]